MTKEQIIKIWIELSDPKIKQIYINHGVNEPVYGVTTQKIKLVAKKIKKDHLLSLELMDTLNYESMYLASLICDSNKITKKDIDNFMNKINSHVISEWIIPTFIFKTKFALELCLDWMNHKNDYYGCVAWTTLSLMIKDKNNNFNQEHMLITNLLNIIKNSISIETRNWTKYAMNSFLISVGVNIIELREMCLSVANEIQPVKVLFNKNTCCKVPNAIDYIKKHR